MCLAANERKRRWYLDSGYSRYMMDDKAQFVTLKTKEGGTTAVGDNGKGCIIKIDNIKIIFLSILRMPYLLMN